MKFSKEKEDSIITDYLQGLNTVQIAKKWNTYNTSIRRVLLRNNIILRSTKEEQSFVKECPFKDNDEYSEYFLGLLLTDGNIFHRKNSVAVSLSLKDRCMVDRSRDFISPKAKVSTILHKKFNTYTYALSVRSDKVAEWLETRGNFYNKSYECDIYIPLTWNILRGIFDGDGYWHNTNKGNTMSWGICGKSKIFLDKVQGFLSANGITSFLHLKKKDYDRTLYYLEVYKLCDVVKLANLMYKGAHIFLIRKYDKWHLFEETLREKFPKFKEGDAHSNPEPSYNNAGHLYNKQNGKYIVEGAETIMGYLNS